MLRLREELRRVCLLGLLLLGAAAGCGDPGTDGNGGREPVVAHPAQTLASPYDAAPHAPRDSQVHTDSAAATGSQPCSGNGDDACAPRNVSGLDLFNPRPAAAGYFIRSDADSVEDVLEKGLRLAGASPAHIVFRGRAAASSIRCAWRGVARTAGQREGAVRFWLGLAATDALPSATEVERRFMQSMSGTGRVTICMDLIGGSGC